jgi:glycoside/pentoside/hexuronide:cation symporter, GPH family
VSTAPSDKNSFFPPDRVDLSRKIAWGFGGMCDSLMLAPLFQLVMPIYNVGLGVSVATLGWVLMIPRFLDAVTDPLMGNISDNTRSRWGRRRPYIFSGALLSAVLFFLMWLPDRSWPVQTVWIYFLVVYCLYALSYTMFVVPFTALAFEMTGDYNERTRVIVWRQILGTVAGLLIPWLYKFCRAPIFGGDEVTGIKYVGGAVAVIIAVTGIVPALFCRERGRAQSQDKIPFFAALRCTFTNRPFLILVTSFFFLYLVVSIVMVYAFYLNLYHVCGGDKDMAANIYGVTTTVLMTTGFFVLPIGTWLSTRMGKKETLLLAMGLTLGGYLLTWVLMTPRWPYLQLIYVALISTGMNWCWLLVPSMLADVCDEDELETGLRREGIFGASLGFVQKCAMAVASLASSWMLLWAGYVDGAARLSEQVVFKMRLIYVGVPALLIGTAMLILYRFPLARERMAEIKELLKARRADVVQKKEE